MSSAHSACLWESTSCATTGLTAVVVAHAAGARFIRVNVLAGAAVTDQGLVQGIAYELLRERARLAAKVRVLADVRVKHASPLAARPLEEECRDLVERAGADGLIVTGPATGSEADARDLSRTKAAAQGRPVYVGSGVDPDNVDRFAAADGFIVGTWFKPGGAVGAPVELDRVRRLCDRVRER